MTDTNAKPLTDEEFTRFDASVRTGIYYSRHQQDELIKVLATIDALKAKLATMYEVDKKKQRQIIEQGVKLESVTKERDALAVYFYCIAMNLNPALSGLYEPSMHHPTAITLTKEGSRMSKIGWGILDKCEREKGG